MSESESKRPSQRPLVTPSEFVQIVRGIASPEIRGRFLDAYNDPTSELHEVLLGLEEWSRGLPGGLSAARGPSSGSQRKKFSDRLERVEQFVRQKHADDVLTVDEVEGIFAARGPVEPQNTSRQVMAAIARMARTLDETHPELHGELVKDLQKRETSRHR